MGTWKRPPDFYCSSQKSEIIGNKNFVLNTWEKAESFESSELIELLARVLVGKQAYIVFLLFTLQLCSNLVLWFLPHTKPPSLISIKKPNLHTSLNNCYLIKFFLSKKLWCVCAYACCIHETQYEQHSCVLCYFTVTFVITITFSLKTYLPGKCNIWKLCILHAAWKLRNLFWVVQLTGLLWHWSTTNPSSWFSGSPQGNVWDLQAFSTIILPMWTAEYYGFVHEGWCFISRFLHILNIYLQISLLFKPSITEFWENFRENRKIFLLYQFCERRSDDTFFYREIFAM